MRMVTHALPVCVMFQYWVAPPIPAALILPVWMHPSALDSDSDGDGIVNTADNCPEDYNPTARGYLPTEREWYR